MAHDIHDALVRKTLGLPENAEGELRTLLPEALVARIDWSTLRAEPGTHVDDALRRRHTDLLFRAELDGRDALLYLLIEHQSSVDRWMALRMLVYMGRVWMTEVEGGADRLPVIVPLVLHHSETGWTAATQFRELLDVPGPEVAAFVPDFGLLVDDLTKVPEVELLDRQMTALAKLTLWALRLARVGPDPELLVLWWSRFDEARAQSGREAFHALLTYLAEVEQGRVVLEAMLDAEDLDDGTREDVMGLRQEWEQQGLEKGLQQGLKQGLEQGLEQGQRRGRAALLLKQLRLKFGELSATDVARVQDASMDQLDDWAARVLTASSLDDVWV